MSNPQTAITPYVNFKNLIKSDNVQERFQALLGARAETFLSGLLTLVNADKKLLECTPASVFTAAAKAAILDLPIAKELGYAWIIPYKQEATFIPGYKGIVQLALRTNKYLAINAGPIYEGETVETDRITGALSVSGERKSDVATHYFAYFKLKNGFEKSAVMTRDEATAHAAAFSSAYQYGMRSGKKDSPWFTHYDDMAIKTVLSRLLKRYGLLSIRWMDDSDDKLNALDYAGHDPRMTVPNFDDTGIEPLAGGEPLEGEFIEPAPESAAPEPVNVANQIIAAAVEANLSENEHAARNTLKLAKPAPDTVEAGVQWFRLYRGWRDSSGADTKQAAKLANEGKVPA